MGQDQHDADLRSQSTGRPAAGQVSRTDVGRRRPSWARCVRRASWRRSASKGRSTAACSRPGSSSIWSTSLRAGDVVVMDNLSSHKSPGVVAAIEAVGAEVRYSAAVFARSQSDRTGLQQVQEAAPRRRRADHRKALATLRQRPRSVHRKRMPKLPPTLRIPLQLKEDRTSVDLRRQTL